MTEPLLEVAGMCGGYGSVPIVGDLNLTVGSGEVVALLGPNGAGKTTTILSIAGILPLQGGSIRFDGRPLVGPLHKRARRGIALVTEERSIIRRLTTSENLRLVGDHVEEAVAIFPELRALLARTAGLLSGGEQQMLALARALVSGPRLLVIDELSLGLAPLVVERLLVEVRATADRGVSVLMVEQHARKALALADRGYVLARGRVIASGTADELAANIDTLERGYLGASPLS